VKAASHKAKPVAKLVYDKDNGGPSGALRAEEILQKLEGFEVHRRGRGQARARRSNSVVPRRTSSAEKSFCRASFRAATGSNTEDRAEALFQMGFLYYETGRVVDASVCFNIVSTDFATSPRAPEAKFNEATCYGSQAKISGGNYWKDQFKGAREDLIKKFPNSSQARDAVYFVAVKKNDAAAVGGSDRSLREGPGNVRPLRRGAVPCRHGGDRTRQCGVPPATTKRKARSGSARPRSTAPRRARRS
jgi:hypothetical protein